MAHGPEIRAAARAAYIYEAMGLEAVAERLHVSTGTVNRWKRQALEAGDDWERARGAARLSGQGAEAVTAAVLEDFVLLFQSTLAEVKADTEIKAINKAEILSRMSDAYHKTISAAGKSNPRLNKLAVAMEVLESLGEFVRLKHPRHAAAFAEILEPFASELARAYG